MALQDGLLSFAIKETIFLSSDRAGIGELQELELVPDVEVLENDSYVSITGCLQLIGKYEPIREAAEANGGGTETLVEAVTFPPFRQEVSEEGTYGWEEQIGHRIPLNITIPLDRIAEIGDIYAIVDSFDYKLESPHQMLIDADLKIMGILLGENQAQPASAHQESAEGAQTWEYAHVADETPQTYAAPSSLDDIEEKLTALEEELKRQALPTSYDSPEAPSVFDAPAIAYNRQEEYQQQYGEVQEPYGEVQELARSESQQPWIANPASYGSDGQAEAQYDSPAYDALAYRDLQTTEPVNRQPETEEPTLAIHEKDDVDYARVATEPADSASPYEAEQVQEVHAEGEEEAAEPVVAQPEVTEETELKVAISGKASREERSNVNITSIFSQATRAKQDAQASEADSSSGSSRHSAAVSTSPATMEAVQNLTSFVRRKEESTSQLKVCIIQRDETLEHISQRYSLPVSKIVEVNRLASEQVVAGQILYIPQ
ncbi:LysM peptidoglycan-binding domain-containing protein [Brevibacillus sp. SAFN-007a]|uniref:LysM peptidoglycan-binding domain-containing protein n=1 Tax=Brevibacillus sp. SAFN-007a TaxID=3436862 RepID=UPI003F80AEB6